MDILEAIKNTAQDTKHEQANYYRLTHETLQPKLSTSTDAQFRAYLVSLLGDKDQEKIFDRMAKVDKNEKRRQVAKPISLQSQTANQPYRAIRCFHCHRFGHTKVNCFRWKQQNQTSALPKKDT